MTSAGADPEGRPPRRRLRRLVGLLIAGATVVFLGLAIGRNWTQIVAYDWAIRPLELVASVAVLILAMAWGIWIWHRVLHRFEAPPPSFRTLLWVWFLSNLARYVPGKIWQFVGAAQLGRRAGVPASVLLTSLLIHSGLTVVSAALVSLLALPTLLSELGALSTAAIAAAAVLGVAGVHPVVLNRALALVPDRFSAAGMRWSGSWADGVLLLAMSVAAWLIYGLAFVLFADAIAGISWTVAPALIAANALAFLVGYMLFTPGGIGTREATLALLLGPLGSLGLAAVIAIAFRLWLIAGEVIGAGLTLLIPGAVPAEEAASPPGRGRRPANGA